jgi:hypothetical protein
MRRIAKELIRPIQSIVPTFSTGFNPVLLWRAGRFGKANVNPRVKKRKEDKNFSKGPVSETAMRR